MTFRFLDFELDETLFELRFGGQLVETQARVFALITYLLRHRARVVAKDELIRELWKAQVVSDTAVSQVVMLARKALRDEGESQRIIKTLRGRGFRFIADVEDATEGATVSAPRNEPPAVVTSAQRPAALARPPRDSLFGRDPELSLLMQRVAAVREGRGGLVLIEGEPGIGKTTLADELAARASALGFDVQWGRAWEAGGAPPFWPWIQVLRGLLKVEGESRIRAWMGRGQAELLTLLPELANTEDASVAGGGDRSRDHFQLFDAMARFLGAACQAEPATGACPSRPRMIVLDDLHAVDEASVQLLRFLAPELEQHALLVVGTLRDLELSRQPVLAQLTTECAGVRRMRLTSLNRADVAGLVEHKLGSAATPQLAGALHEASGGNPLLLAELCRRFDSDAPERLAELAALRGEPLPERIARAVRSHLSELPVATRQALAPASALGRAFSMPLLAALLGSSETELLERLAPALQRGVVRQAASPDELVFSHALICNAVYADVTPNARIELHRQIAELLERTRTLEHSPLYDIAHHYALAAAGGCRPQALHYARLAAEKASSLTAYEVAAALYDRSSLLAEAEGADHLELHELLILASEAWYRVGNLDQAVARLDRAADLARADHCPERLVSAAINAASVLRGAVLYDRTIRRHVQDGLASLPPGDSMLRAGALAVSAITMRSVGTAAERETASQEAIEMARRLGDDEILQWTLNARHLALWGIADPRELLSLTSEMLQLGRRTGNRELVLDALLWRVVDCFELGGMDSSRLAREEYGFEVERMGSPWHRYMLLVCDAYEVHALGEFERGRECSERARQLGVRLREPLAEAFYAVRSLFRQFDLGFLHRDPACRALAANRDPPSCVPNDHRMFWALAWAAQGRRVEAEREVAQFLALDKSRVIVGALRRPLLCVMAEVCAFLGDREHAARIYPLLLPAAGLYAHMQAGVSLGPVSYYLGRLACCLAQSDAASVHFEQALTETSNSLPSRARTLYGYSRTLALQPSTSGRARELLHETYAIAASLDMADLREAAQQDLKRIGM